MLIRSDSGQENGAIDLIVVVLFLPVLFAVIAIALDYSRGPIASRTLENALRNAAWGVVPPIFSSNECLSLGSVPPMIYNAGVPTNPVPPGTSNPGNTLGPSENYCDAYPWMSQIDSSDTWGLEPFTPAAHNFAELSDKINNSVGLESHRDTPKPCVEQAAANLNSSFFNEAVSLKYAELAAYLTAKSLASGSSWLFDYVSDDEISGAAGGDSPLAIAMGVVWISANDTTGEFSTSGYPVYTGSPGYFPAGATGASLVNDYSSQSGLSNNSPRQIVSELVSQAQSVGVSGFPWWIKASCSKTELGCQDTALSSAWLVGVAFLKLKPLLGGILPGWKGDSKIVVRYIARPLNNVAGIEATN